MRILGIIPARYDSSRFPGKPLAMINGKPMIQRVYEQAIQAGSLQDVIVATDDQRIIQAVKVFKGEARLTGKHHRSGTDRCYELVSALEAEGKTFDVVVNIQGDEPYINPLQIDEVTSAFSEPAVSIATLAKKIESKEVLFNPNVVKLIMNQSGDAIYFSRHPIPFQQNIEKSHWLTEFKYFRHIGIYAYRPDVLKVIAGLEISPLEQAESLEQLRWIEHGLKIRVNNTHYESHAVDTPEDLSKFVNMA